MYHWRGSHGPVDLAFTDRFGGASAAPFDELNLALGGDDDPTITSQNLHLVLDDFAPGCPGAQMSQVHGRTVAQAVPSEVSPACDALVTDEPDVVLVVRVADCVPVLLADAGSGVIGAVHAGRPGVLAGVVTEAVSRMGALGARDLRAWIGPHVCGGCYEVPEALRDEVASAVPATFATTTWGTPALDLGAGVEAQLREAGVSGIADVADCTRESSALFSYRRDGDAAGRLAGLVRRHA